MLLSLAMPTLGTGCIETKSDTAADSGASSSPTGPGGSSGTTDTTDYGEPDGMEGMVAAHNAIRDGVGVPGLVWDDDLADIAAEWSARLAADGCYLEHDYSSPYGENLYWSTFDSTPEQVVNSWASEVEFYDYDSNSCVEGEMCGHYTQVVWSTTERVGCAKTECSDGSEIWMCDYDPPGNYVGEWPY
jgi:pathogenesis-related protein 1